MAEREYEQWAAELVSAIAVMIPTVPGREDDPSDVDAAIDIQRLLIRATSDLRRGREFAFVLASEAAVLLHRLARASGTTIHEEARKMLDRATPPLEGI